ncbi:MAG: hypothetical protein U0263_32525 [Polyangiaceae bacterium]
MRAHLGFALLTCAFFVTTACGSDSDGGGSSSGSCDAVCSCVVAQGGDGAQCQSECAATVQAGGNVKEGCEAKLDGFGFPGCKPKCEGFPTGG